MSAPFKRRRDGRYSVRLDPGVRAVLVALSERTVPILGPDEPVSRRLFPPAYTGEDHKRADEEYRTLVDTALVNHHRGAFTTLAETVGAEILTGDELEAWLSSIGSMRLVLGTKLDVSEEMTDPAPDDPTAPEYAVYELLGQLQYLMVEVLSAELPPEGRPGEAL